ncbi:hypothetical protein [Novosphingobium humi]|uniref:hypothetical protein n=1 Tax=Novosphingobium humi TaxID=2282397 RepID=UPI0025B23040|nr:hypothetical protein [Novosphingobium humi]WJS97834.1 hypothetical protein NYQ05_11890 [Novosphingobium humi]
MAAGKFAQNATLFAISPAYALTRILLDTVNENKAKSPNTDLDDARKETERQEIEMRRQEAQAKVAQELAIAARIENALEVQIEEFYEYNASGKAGLNSGEGGVEIGISGSGKRISKRVYKFVGHTAPPTVEPDQDA